jgi:hypothetical protein
MACLPKAVRKDINIVERRYRNGHLKLARKIGGTVQRLNLLGSVSSHLLLTQKDLMVPGGCDDV